MKIPWLISVPFWFHFCCFSYPFGSILALEISTLVTRIYKAPAEELQTPQRKTSTLQGPRAEPFRSFFDPLWARKRPRRVYLAMLFLANNLYPLGSLRRFPPEESLICNNPGPELSSARSAVGTNFRIKFRVYLLPHLYLLPE